MKYQVLLSLKNNENIFKTVVCFCCDWRLKDQQSTVCKVHCNMITLNLSKKEQLL